MKIEAGNNVFVLDFKGDSNEEERVFLEVSKQMIDKRLGTEPVKESTVEVKPIEVKTIEVKAPEVKVPASTVNPPTELLVGQPRKKYDSVREFLEAQERRLIVGECDCEKVYHFWVDDPNQKEFKFKCHRCGEEKVIAMDDLVPANYKCEDCGKQSSFWMEPSQSVAIDCVACKHEIDMYYHDKKKIMTNII